MNAPRLVTLALVLVMGSACQTWRTVPQSAGLPRPLAARSRVIRTDGSRIEITRGLATGDSVVGLSRAAGRVSVPRDSVARVEERRVSWGRTTALIAVSAVAVAISAGLAYAVSGPEALPY